MDETNPGSNRSFIATFLVVAGLIWMSLTGLCTAGFVVSSFFGGSMRLSDLFSVLAFVLVVGVICFAPGFLMWIGGKALRGRKAR